MKGSHRFVITGVALACNAVAADAGDTRREVDTYARAAKLLPLKEGDADQVRIWVSWANFGETPNGISTIGYVVSGRLARRCHIDYVGESVKPSGGGCRLHRPSAKRAQIMSDLESLSAFANVYIDCGMVDGQWLVIEAVAGGKRFVLSANNPGSCGGDAAKLVSKLLADAGEG